MLSAVGFIVVKLEVDQGAEHLQIGDERIRFRSLARDTAIFAGDRFRVALGEPFDARVVCGRLGPQVVMRPGGHVLGIRSALHGQNFHVALDMGEIQLSGEQPRIARHDGDRNDGAWVLQVIALPVIRIVASSTEEMVL